jgi:hypothetical protein
MTTAVEEIVEARFEVSEGAELEGELAASSTSGEISVLDSNLRRFSLSTVSGT